MNDRYPNIGLRSKNELAKRICGRDFSQLDALNLINDSVENFDTYWKDHATMSNPEKLKWVRDASYSRLGKLHRLINRKVLAPYDRCLPSIIHGGVSCKDIKSAARALLGTKRKRTLLKVDMRRFYEHISNQDVIRTLHKKMGCSDRAAKLIAKLCCVHDGPKDNPLPNLTLARGFSTSSRLAIWCNLDLFYRIFWEVKKTMRGHDPRIITYVDDICITASKVSPEAMANLYFKIIKLVENSTCGLEINTEKTGIISYLNRGYDLSGNYIGFAPYETLGINLKRNSTDVGVATKSRLVRLENKSHLNASEKKTREGLKRHISHIRS